MTTTPSGNERRMRAYIEAWNDHDPEAVVGFLSAECDQYSREGLREICESWFAAFPDLTHEIEELAVDEEWVLARLTLRGTHRGPFMGVPATGTEIEVADHVSTRFEDGRIVEHHATADTAALLEQLGVTVPPDVSDGTAGENEALVRRFFEAFNDRDREGFVGTMSEDFTCGSIEGPEEMADDDWRWIEATDLTWGITAMHATDEFVTTRAIARGTHRGEILGLEPTGESFEVTAMTLSRVEDGQIVERWAEWDFAGLLHQIGAIDARVYGD